jgi:hypothetical protein
MNRAEQVDRDGYAIVPAVVDELVVEICSNSSVEAICREPSGSSAQDERSAGGADSRKRGDDWDCARNCRG